MKYCSRGDWGAAGRWSRGCEAGALLPLEEVVEEESDEIDDDDGEEAVEEGGGQR